MPYINLTSDLTTLYITSIKCLESKSERKGKTLISSYCNETISYYCRQVESEKSLLIDTTGYGDISMRQDVIVQMSFKQRFSTK